VFFPCSWALEHESVKAQKIEQATGIKKRMYFTSMVSWIILNPNLNRILNLSLRTVEWIKRAE
jgi:hypothetical protein